MPQTLNRRGFLGTVAAAFLAPKVSIVSTVVPVERTGTSVMAAMMEHQPQYNYALSACVETLSLQPFTMKIER